jgi:hypothetical protein
MGSLFEAVFVKEIVMRAPPTVMSALVRGYKYERKSQRVRTMPVALHMEDLFPVRVLSVILPGDAHWLVLQGPKLIALHIIKDLLVVQAEELCLALQQLDIGLVVDVEAVLSEGPDLLLHDQRLLAVHTEGGDKAHGIRQRREHNRS